MREDSICNTKKKKNKEHLNKNCIHSISINQVFIPTYSVWIKVNIIVFYIFWFGINVWENLNLKKLIKWLVFLVYNFQFNFMIYFFIVIWYILKLVSDRVHLIQSNYFHP